MSQPGLPADFDVAQWLGSLGLGQYGESFLANGITGGLLPALTDENLRALGVAEYAHRKLILDVIAHLTGAGPRRPAVPVVRARGPVATSPGQQPRAVKPRVVATAKPAAAKPATARPRLVSAAPAAAAPRVVATAPVAAPPAPVAVTPDFAQPVAPAKKKRRNLWAKIIASKFLFVSILAHLIFAGGATYFIVQRVQAGRKLTFQGGPPSPNPSKRALEHKVSMAQKRRAGGAPPQARRIVSAGLAKISLPEMPSLPSVSNDVTGMMAGMGGAGFGQGMGIGSGMGGGMGGGEGAGGMTMFGFHDSRSGGLRGEMYDTKQTEGRKSTGMSFAGYGEAVAKFIKSGWNEDDLHKYYKATKVLYAPQFLVPNINAELAPKAFGVEKEIQPKMWLCLYKGTVTAPESGTFHFVGRADDILFVRFNGKTVLNGSLMAKSELGGDGPDRELGVKTEARYDYAWLDKGRPFAEGEAFSVQEGDTYPIEVLIGEWPGGWSNFVLFIQKDGEHYDKTATGAPVLPVFRMADVPAPPLDRTQTFPPYRHGGTIWPAHAEGTGSLLDSLNR